MSMQLVRTMPHGMYQKTNDVPVVQSRLCAFSYLLGSIHRNEGVTSLWIASAKGHFGIVRMLLKNGAMVNMARVSAEANDDGATPFHLACQCGHLDIARLLVEYAANIHTSCRDGETPLWAASEHGQAHTVGYLIASGVSVEAAWDGILPLSIACENGHWDVIKQLVVWHCTIGREKIFKGTNRMRLRKNHRSSRSSKRPQVLAGGN